MNSEKTTAILLVGVGGQGTILASKILSEALCGAGFDVKMSEIHGMSQRGGNVSTQIRFGEKVFSPIVGKGEADVIVAFEKMEALRWIEYLKPGGSYIINDYEIPPGPVLMGAAEYPQGIISDLESRTGNVLVIDAAGKAEEAGSARAMNIVLLGAAVKALDSETGGKLSGVDWDDIIEKSVKPGFAELNKKAFKLGFES
jgi:indolepyruvate ferredoxin oxidoreductase beta subunit